MDLTVYLEQVVRHFSRYHKYTLGSDLRQHSRVALLQFLPISFKVLKPKRNFFTPVLFGEHIRKKRLELGLTQKEAGKVFGVTSFTVSYWEHGIRKSAIGHIPAICQFLGYDPESPTPSTFAEWLVAKRRQFGWTQRVAARKLGVDPSTWSAWENGGRVMSKPLCHLVAKFIWLSDKALFFMMQKWWEDSQGKSFITK